MRRAIPTGAILGAKVIEVNFLHGIALPVWARSNIGRTCGVVRREAHKFAFPPKAVTMIGPHPAAFLTVRLALHARAAINYNTTETHG